MPKRRCASSCASPGRRTKCCRATSAPIRSSAIARGLLNAAPLDLRANLARTSREEVLARLERDGIEAAATPYAPSAIRLAGKPAINNHPLFRDGLIEVQ